MALETEISQCRKCAEFLAQNLVDPTSGAVRVEPRPIVPHFERQPILLIGQAPGLTEYRTGKPFQGNAGQGIRGILAEVGLPRERFDEIVYSTAIVKCFPGSKRVRRGREDEKPSKEMVSNCLPFLKRAFELLRPQLVITLGRFPLVEYLKLRGRDPSAVSLDKFVGTLDEWDGAAVIFLPHTSGSSRWLNKPSNRELLERAKHTLQCVLLKCKLAC
jgi:uracil-DNA glycosylase